MSSVSVSEKNGRLTANFSNLGGYTVANYKLSKELSDETSAFSAVIKRENREIGRVSNRGHGGSNDYSFDSRDEQKAFLECAGYFYPGSEGEDSFVDELVVRNQMQHVVVKKAREHFPIAVLFRSNVVYVSKDFFYFQTEQYTSFMTLEGARSEIAAKEPNEYVIYDSERNEFEAVRHTPDAATIKRLDREERERADEQTRRENAWSDPTPLDSCERFLISQNEDNKVKIFDAETGREVETDLCSFNNGRKILTGLFGAQK